MMRNVKTESSNNLLSSVSKITKQQQQQLQQHSQVSLAKRTQQRQWTSVHNQYRTIEILGQGTYGVVYKAEDKTTGEIVALKRCRLDVFKEFGIPETTLREVVLLKDLQHENIMKLHKVSCNTERLYMICEFLELDLRKFLRANPKGIPIRKVKEITYELFKGLAFCHGHRVIHRDLKPHNILISADASKVKIADFGLSRAILAPGKTLTHEVITLWYRAPELLLGHCNYSAGVDIWSAGCIVAELLSSRPLFIGDSEIDTLFKIFRILGTPKKQDWPEHSVVGWNDFPVFEEKADPFKHLSQELDADGRDFFSKIFQFNPSLRSPAIELLNHPWLNEAHETISSSLSISDHSRLIPEWKDWAQTPIENTTSSLLELDHHSSMNTNKTDIIHNNTTAKKHNLEEENYYDSNNQLIANSNTMIQNKTICENNELHNNNNNNNNASLIQQLLSSLPVPIKMINNESEIQAEMNSDDNDNKEKQHHHHDYEEKESKKAPEGPNVIRNILDKEELIAAATAECDDINYCAKNDDDDDDDDNIEGETSSTITTTTSNSVIPRANMKMMGNTEYETKATTKKLNYCDIKKPNLFIDNNNPQHSKANSNNFTRIANNHNNNNIPSTLVHRATIGCSTTDENHNVCNYSSAAEWFYKAKRNSLDLEQYLHSKIKQNCISSSLIDLGSTQDNYHNINTKNNFNCANSSEVITAIAKETTTDALPNKHCEKGINNLKQGKSPLWQQNNNVKNKSQSETNASDTCSTNSYDLCSNHSDNIKQPYNDNNKNPSHNKAKINHQRNASKSLQFSPQQSSIITQGHFQNQAFDKEARIDRHEQKCNKNSALFCSQHEQHQQGRQQKASSPQYFSTEASVALSIVHNNGMMHTRNTVNDKIVTQFNNRGSQNYYDNHLQYETTDDTKMSNLTISESHPSIANVENDSVSLNPPNSNISTDNISKGNQIIHNNDGDVDMCTTSLNSTTRQNRNHNSSDKTMSSHESETLPQLSSLPNSSSFITSIDLVRPPCSESHEIPKSYDKGNIQYHKRASIASDNSNADYIMIKNILNKTTNNMDNIKHKNNKNDIEDYEYKNYFNYNNPADIEKHVYINNAMKKKQTSNSIKDFEMLTASQDETIAHHPQGESNILCSQNQYKVTKVNNRGEIKDGLNYIDHSENDDYGAVNTVQSLSLNSNSNYQSFSTFLSGFENEMQKSTTSEMTRNKRHSNNTITDTNINVIKSSKQEQQINVISSNGTRILPQHSNDQNLPIYRNDYHHNDSYQPKKDDRVWFRHSSLMHGKISEYAVQEEEESKKRITSEIPSNLPMSSTSSSSSLPFLYDSLQPTNDGRVTSLSHSEHPQPQFHHAPTKPYITWEQQQQQQKRYYDDKSNWKTQKEHYTKLESERRLDRCLHYDHSQKKETLGDSTVVVFNKENERGGGKGGDMYRYNNNNNNNNQNCSLTKKIFDTHQTTFNLDTISPNKKNHQNSLTTSAAVYKRQMKCIYSVPIKEDETVSIDDDDEQNWDTEATSLSSSLSSSSSCLCKSNNHHILRTSTEWQYNNNNSGSSSKQRHS